MGLKSDGTVVAVGPNYHGQLDVGSWTDIVQVAAGRYHNAGLKTDGTVVAVGFNSAGLPLNVGSWTDIVQVEAGNGHNVGLKSDGTVVAVGDNNYGQLNVGSWTDIVLVDAGWHHTVGLKSDGTVVAVGDNFEGQGNTGGWNLFTNDSDVYQAIEKIRICAGIPDVSMFDDVFPCGSEIIGLLFGVNAMKLADDICDTLAKEEYCEALLTAARAIVANATIQYGGTFANAALSCIGE